MPLPSLPTVAAVLPATCHSAIVSLSQL